MSYLSEVQEFCCLVAKLCLTLVTPWTVALQAPLSWDFPGKNTGVGCHFLLKGIFPTQGLNLGLLHCTEPLRKHQWNNQFSSVAQLCLTLCNPMNHSTPGLHVHQLHLEFTQTHVRRVSEPSHPLSSPSPPAPNPSQHQSLFR